MQTGPHFNMVTVAQRSGLSVTAVKELLEKGWTWVESIHHPPRWESPARNFTITTKEGK